MNRRGLPASLPADEALAVACRGVCLSYKKKQVLCGAALSVPRGTVTVLLGKNGSGKTTLLRCIAGLRKASAGEIFLFGTPVSALSPRERAKRVAVMPQTLPLLHRTVAELIAMGRSPYLGVLGGAGERDRQIAARAAAQTDMTAHLQDAVCTLSGGERQLAYFAMALAQDTKLLLLDEPTASLDAEYSRRVYDAIRTLSGEGYTFLLTLHDLDDAVAIADRIAVLDGGRTVFEGDPAAFTASGVPERVFSLAPVRAVSDEGERFTLFRPLP